MRGVIVKVRFLKLNHKYLRLAMAGWNKLPVPYKVRFTPFELALELPLTSMFFAKLLKINVIIAFLHTQKNNVFTHMIFIAKYAICSKSIRIKSFHIDYFCYI